jgi:hypothetical protein
MVIFYQVSHLPYRKNPRSTTLYVALDGTTVQKLMAGFDALRVLSFVNVSMSTSEYALNRCDLLFLTITC